ncbi:hypothetical protein COLO4_13318 [Corchorus olitorius]|uniref:non-specific serine/threonine protein kinase n=1 Tax=Corchorus olitorius TaxID=93759 RepID=A0A1R3JX92_9ROSI|nr:hypothetical protein COLO4_13318 [Corchorus olitorius]
MSSKSSPRLGLGGKIAIALAFGIGLPICLIFLYCCFNRRGRRIDDDEERALHPSSRKSAGHAELGCVGYRTKEFTYTELEEATNGFSEENELGEGGCGYVYKGRLGDGREVAVKVLKSGGLPAAKQFKVEVDSISRANHTNLISLVGYCIYGDKRLIVYDYAPNKTLHFHLHGKDIKSSNILLDSNFEPLVSDFGLAKLDPNSRDRSSNVGAVGTYGYVAPEYAMSGILSEKADVYSFGVVLLELTTGRKAVFNDSETNTPESLAEWARSKLDYALQNKQIVHLVDPKLGNMYNEKQVLQMIWVANACLQLEVGSRPTMGQVVHYLEYSRNQDLKYVKRQGGHTNLYSMTMSESDSQSYKSASESFSEMNLPDETPKELSKAAGKRPVHDAIPMILDHSGPSGLKPIEEDVEEVYES